MIVLFKYYFKMFLLSIGFLILFCIFSGHAAYAEENYKLWNDGNVITVNKDKVWTVTFNRDVDMTTAKNYIKVYRADDNENVDIDISSKENNVLSIAPKSPYESGESYILEIGSDMEDIDGNKLNQSIRYNFKIDSNDSSNDSSDDSSDDNNSNIRKKINIENYNEYYNAVKNAMANYESQLTLNISNYDKSIYNLDVIDHIVEDSPELMVWYNSAKATIQSRSDGTSIFTINFNYSDTRENIIEKDEEINNKIEEIVDKVTSPEMEDYEKELALHDYVVNNTKYDERADTDIDSMPMESYNAYGVLINGVGVCQGYADAMYRLLKAAGIENEIAVGSANNGTGWVAHAWNIVKIQGKYYQLDSTWDDPVASNGENILSHSYFNVTDSKLSADHQWDRSQYPECNSTDYNYNRIKIIEMRNNILKNSFKIAS
jgi:transglutaminase/protease-like cytokinesis protein 3